MNVNSTVGESLKKLNKTEMEKVFGATGSEIQPQSTPLCSFVASYIISAQLKCGGDNKP